MVVIRNIMPFEKNFSKIFLDVLIENRDKKLNSIL